MRKEPALQTKRSEPENRELKEILADPEHHALFLHFHQAEGKNQLVQRLLMFLCYLVKLEMSETHMSESKLAEEPLSVATTPLHELATMNVSIK